MFYERHLKSWVIIKTANLPNKRSSLLQSIPPSDSEGGRASGRASPMAKVREIPAASDGDNNGSERNETVSSNPTHGRVTLSSRGVGYFYSWQSGYIFRSTGERKKVCKSC